MAGSSGNISPGKTDGTAIGGIAGAVPAFWKWWRSEIQILVPRRAGYAIPVSAVDAVINLNAQSGVESVEVIRKRRGGANTGELGGNDALAQLAREMPGARVAIRLPHTAVFKRHIDLPAGAGAHAHSILALDLERATPFKLADVYTAEIVEASRVRKGMLTASQLIVKRRTVDPVMADIESAGLSVARLDCWGEDGAKPLPVNFLAKTAPVPVQEGSHTWRTAAAVIAVGLSVSTVYTALARRDAALESLERDVAQSRTKADAVRLQTAAVEAAAKDRNAVQNLKWSRPAAVEQIDELTRLLADDVELTDLKIDGGTADISGFAKSAARLVPILERSVMFKDATLTAPVAFDAALDKERVSIRVRLRQTSPQHAEAAP